MQSYNVKCLCLTTQRQRERQFDICADSCFQSTGRQKDDIIRERGRKLSENTENETIMKRINNKTHYSNFVVLDVVVLLRKVPIIMYRYPLDNSVLIKRIS